jgi:hypothetical protein
MEELLEKLILEVEEMLFEAPLIGDEKYRTGYIQALLNVQSTLKFKLGEL